MFVNEEVNRSAGEFIRNQVRETVHDPRVAELLAPHSMVGCKRPCADTGYYETYNRDNVTLIDISQSPVEEITETGLRGNGNEYELECILFATGFDAMTGSLLRIDIRGRGGVPLGDKWAEGPKTYLGLSVTGFPNFFTITGPGSPSVLANMIPAIEQHVNWIADCIVYTREHGFSRIEATLDAETEGRARQRDRRPHHLPDLQLVVCGCQHSREAPGLHALSRLPAVPEEVR